MSSEPQRFENSVTARNSRTTILLSTYNGSKYLPEQIQSIINQTDSNWILLIRDDGSSDNTTDIIDFYCAQDYRIKHIRDSRGNLGPANSFIELLQYVSTDYFMFSDQDDVWLPNKVNDSILPLTKSSAPHLLCTDLVVVNQDLAPISPSFMQLSKFDGVKGTTQPKALIQNVVVGCTISGNKALLDASNLLLKNTPQDMMMHDWWLALVALFFGKITYLDEPTILYRQHGGNCLGAKGSSYKKYLYMLANQKPWRRAQKYLKSVTLQCKSFQEFYGDRLSPEQNALLNKVISISSDHTLLAIIKCQVSGISMHSASRNIALLASFASGKINTIWAK